MRTVRYTSRFRRDYRREKSGRHGRHLDAHLLATVTMLAKDEPLPRRYFDHPLGGEWSDHRLPHPTGPHPDLPEAGPCEPRARPAGHAQRAWPMNCNCDDHAELARAHPQVHVEPDRIFTRDGGVWTSAGVTAGIDLALALVVDDLGEAVAKRAAQQLVVYYRRPDGQSQFSPLLEADGPGSRFSPVLGWARERLGERLSGERLADRAAMSQRHF